MVGGGDRCVKDGQPAVCTPISKCQSALADIVKMKLPQPLSDYSCKQFHFQACALQGSELTVCCVDDPAASPARAPPTRTTSEDAFPAYEYEHEHQQAPDGCEPIPSRLTTQRTGRKAWDKCIEYQEKYVYPCESRLALGESKIRVDHCGHDPDELDAGGASIKMGQFPHMSRPCFHCTIRHIPEWAFAFHFFGLKNKFAQLEGHIALSGISDDKTKFYFVISQIEHRFAAETEKEVKQLLADEEMSDRCPSQSQSVTLNNLPDLKYLKNF
ncbi:hypothetical protein EVAR_97795_1 [Eumeta japonica]|uniref:CLIP domain-containing serine protease n=1 Tax=Eumeta variegata TaxID=151549 RepID=A0A4C1X9Q4_EUMVA|nr:hypothetical protein EVAR_97795_1 [Eumeta japonica]